ncbi:hypothetical protein [Enterococcus faecium]
MPIHGLFKSPIAVVVIGLLAIPQLQYRKNPDGYFLIVEDYDTYAEKQRV